MTFKETLESNGFVKTSDDDDCYTKHGQRAWIACPLIVFQEFKYNFWQTVRRCHNEESALAFLGDEWI